MNDDIKCCYCGKWQEINHDDGYGYEEDKLHLQECVHCGKTFGYHTMITVSHSNAIDLPCKNGHSHKFKDKNSTSPDCFNVGVAVCEWCGEEKVVDEKARGKAIDKFFASLHVDKSIE